MQVTILYPFFADAGQPGDSLMRDFAKALQSAGHSVAVVTGEGGYMTRKAVTSRPFWHLWWRDSVAGVAVVRCVSLSNPRSGKIRRMIGYLIFAAIAGMVLIGRQRSDVIFASSPPVYSAVLALLGARLRGARLVLEVRDIWSDSLCQLAALERRRGGLGSWVLVSEHGPVICLTRWLERLLYRRADAVVALTPAIRRSILASGGRPAVTSVARCGVDLELLRPEPESVAAFRESRGWQDMNLVMYIGTMGLAHDMETLVEAARLLSLKDVDCRLVLVGDGIKRAATLARIRTLELDNIVVLDPVPRAEINAIFNVADLCLISLKDVPVFIEALPTKLFDTLAAGRPVLHCLRGEAQRIVEEAEAGWHYRAGDAADLAGKIAEALSDPTRLREAGRKGRRYAEAHFGIAARNEALIRLMTKVAEQ